MKSRRDFIKITAAGAGAAALGLSPLKWGGLENLNAANDVNAVSDEDMTPYPTYCEVCFWKCAGWTYVDKKGDIRKIIGNKEDPHCNGRLCPRGTGGVGMYNDEDRLKTPLIRRFKENGDAYFEKVSWDEALDYTAKKLKAIADEHGPE